MAEYGKLRVKRQWEPTVRLAHQGQPVIINRQMIRGGSANGRPPGDCPDQGADVSASAPAERVCGAARHGYAVGRRNVAFGPFSPLTSGAVDALFGAPSWQEAQARVLSVIADHWR